MKGIVIAIKQDRCVVLKKDGTFSYIKNLHYVVGQEIFIRHTSSIRRACTAAACLAITCIAAFSGYSLLLTPVSHVYLDACHSVRLDLNRFESVLSVVPLSNGAETLLKAIPVSSGNVETCIKEIIQAYKTDEHASFQDNAVEISLASNQSELDRGIQDAASMLESQNISVTIHSVDPEDNQLAIKYNISGKHLRALRAYTTYFGGTLKENTKKLTGKTADEILEAIRMHRRSTPGRDVNAEETKPLAGTENHSASGDSKSREERRQTALIKYAEIFGGSPEEHQENLKNLSIMEIYHEIRTYRSMQNTTE